MIDVLTIINNELEEMNVPYTFDGWDDDMVLPQFVGEISEIPTSDEDGRDEYSLILTGYAMSNDYLFGVAGELRKKYKNSLIINGVVIKYDNAIPVDSGDENLKQIQINLLIKKWSE